MECRYLVLAGSFSSTATQSHSLDDEPTGSFDTPYHS